MKTDEKLSGAIQENILIILCFDKVFCKLARYAVTPQLFESAIFREIAGVAIDFIDQFGEPVSDHLPDHLEHILKGEDTRKAASYKRIIDNLFLSKDSTNGEYVMTQVHKFVRQQVLKDAFKRSVEAFEAGDVDGAEVAMQEGLKKQVISFEPGIDLADPTQALTFLDNTEAPLLTGIDALDKYGIGPANKTVYLVTGPLGKGKSWWLMQIGKYALLQREVVVHITLEMSAEKTVQRYMQMLFAVTKRTGGARVPRMTKSFDGGIDSIEFEHLDLPSMQDDDIRELLTRQISRRLTNRAKFKVKKFPSGSLTIPMLNAYLDGLERYEGLIPTTLIIDYAELMFLDQKDKRGSIGSLFVDLRGIADSRNLKLVTASQVNRTGIGKTTTNETDLSEDISKAFTVDTMVTYNQTPMEHKMGLARLHVAKHRDDADKMTALITQGYSMGQFCLDSVEMSDRYMASIDPRSGKSNEDEEENDRGSSRRRATPRR